MPGLAVVLLERLVAPRVSSGVEVDAAGTEKEEGDDNGLRNALEMRTVIPMAKTTSTTQPSGSILIRRTLVTRVEATIPLP